jgi:hypothetical protein
MSDNPFQSPATDARVVGVRGGSREELRKVATYQKGVLVCILIQIAAVVAQFVIPPELLLFVSLASLVVSLAGTVFVLLLAVNLYSTGLGVVLGILALVPCVGLIVLLSVNGKATRVLRQNGIQVGLLGADLSKV